MAGCGLPQCRRHVSFLKSYAYLPFRAFKQVATNSQEEEAMRPNYAERLNLPFLVKTVR